MKAVKVFCVIVALVAASAVAWQFYFKATIDYAFAERANTVAAYQHFLDSHPKDKHRQRVMARIDDLSWDLAQKSGSIADVDAYIRHFPSGTYVKEASELKDRLEIASLPVFEGRAYGVMEVGSPDSSGALSHGAPLILLETKAGRYQILTSGTTIYQGMVASDAGVRWDLGKQFRVKGKLADAPKGPHLDGVKFIDARVVQELQQSASAPAEAKKTTSPGTGFRVAGSVQAAKLINRVEPTYPSLAMRARVQGTVRFDAVIAKDGTVKDLKLAAGNPILVSAASDAVKQWRYEPTLIGGQPVEVSTTIDVDFALKQ